MGKIQIDRHKPERLERTQAGMESPLALGENKWSAEGTKDHLSPFQGFRVLDAQYRGFYPPVCGISPLRGYLCFNVNDRIMDR